MSEEEKRQQRADLLIELDDHKSLLANLKERGTRDRETFHAFAQSYTQQQSPVIEGDVLRIGSASYPFALLEVKAAVERRLELNRAIKRHDELSTRARQLGITLG
jgi:hypothetical protein